MYHNTKRIKSFKYISLIIVIIFGFNNCVDTANRTKKQVGFYVIDIEKTNLGAYVNDTVFLKRLTLEFKSDYTFSFNMSVPFIFDSVGTWEVGNDPFNQWNKMKYQNSKFSDQFYQCCDSDRTFNMNSITPRPSHKPIQTIWFKPKKDNKKKAIK